MNRIELAKENFRTMNCNQAVFTVFAEKYGLSSSIATYIGLGFGGGMAQGKTCGVVSGAYMVIGLWTATKTKDLQEQKALAKAKLKEFNFEFKKRQNSLNCKTLLGFDLSLDEERLNAHESGAFDTKCPIYVVEAVTILEDILD